jgi:hypothetical protein
MNEGVTAELIFVLADTLVPLCCRTLASTLVDDDVAQAAEIAEVLDVVR